VTEQASNIMTEGPDASVKGKGPKGTIAFSDAALVEQCRRGDMQAFGSLVAKYQDRIFNMIYRMCGRRADAEELAQEAFLKALERITQFRGQSQFYTWLFRIAANLTISHRRRGGRVRFQSLSGPEEFEQSQADALTAAMARRRTPAPEAAVMAAETHQRVMEALEELDDEFRLVVVLCDIEDMDYAQIAQVLGVPVGTVKSRLHRARCMLKEKLADLRVGK
jgi:RNA polymerase sigma-70 factor (ECF subfamily)